MSSARQDLIRNSTVYRRVSPSQSEAIGRTPESPVIAISRGGLKVLARILDIGVSQIPRPGITLMKRRTSHQVEQ